MPVDYPKKILEADIYDLVRVTPLDETPKLSARIENRVVLKREDLQSVFSFKLRGAYNCIRLLSDKQKKAGVIAASAGNHAQGVALAARHLGIKATIVMPKTTPSIKVGAVEALGGNVILYGDTYDEASALAQELVEQKNFTHIPPFDHPDVISGQGTIAVEILQQLTGDIDAIFVAVGGGGLCAGVASYIKHVRPEIRIVAVEPADAACLKLAIDTGRRGRLSHVGLFADGVAVAQIGEKTFPILKELVDEIVTVSTDEICAAIKDIYEDTRSIAEPAGALSVAGIKSYVSLTGAKSKTFVGINCGANMNFDRLRYISERTEIGEKREAVFAITIPEKAGSFRKFCKTLGKRNITEFNYRYKDSGDAHIYVGVQIAEQKDRGVLVTELEEACYSLLDLTDDELAKNHIRHMVGGHSDAVGEELVYRFEFPERPGALMAFLSALGSKWNISMFHYRSHGAAFGRVMLGVQASKSERKKVRESLDTLGYEYWEETDNPAYQLFLG